MNSNELRKQAESEENDIKDAIQWYEEVQKELEEL